MKQPEHASVQCIFCEDIREEANGKSTIIGWYGADSVQIPDDGPLSIPSLGIIMLATLPVEPRFEALRVELIQDGKVQHGIDLPADAIAEMQRDESRGEKAVVARQIRIAIKLQSLTITEPGSIALRMIIDKQVIEGNDLRFTR